MTESGTTYKTGPMEGGQNSVESTGGRPGYCGASVQEGDTLIHGEGSVSS